MMDKYDPLKEFSPFYAKIEFVMNFFDELMKVLREKLVRLQEVYGQQQLSSQPLEP